MLHPHALEDLRCWILLGAVFTWTGCGSAPDEQTAAPEPSSDPPEVRTDTAASSAVSSSPVDAAPSPPAPPETVTPCAGKTGVIGDQTFSLSSGGLARDYALHVPDSYDPTLPTMLVIGFHGFSSDSTQQALNGCSDAAGIVYQEGDATCEEWSGCRDNATVRLCTIDGGGHTWPGGIPIPFGKTSVDIDATREMVAFFEGHPMP